MKEGDPKNPLPFERMRQVPGKSYFWLETDTPEDEKRMHLQFMVDQCKARAQQDTAMRMLEEGIGEDTKYRTLTGYPVGDHAMGGQIVVVIQTKVYKNEWDFFWEVAFCPTKESIEELKSDISLGRGPRSRA